MPVTVPAFNAVPFATSGSKNTIPVSPPGGGAASMTNGFPPETMQPLNAGGIPPSGQDMNGILYQMSTHQVFLNAGGLYKFDATLSTAVGGYRKGAVLMLDNELSSVQSTVDNNTTNPNSSMTGWQLYGGKLVNDKIDALETEKYDTAGGTITGDVTINGVLNMGTPGVDENGHTRLPNGLILQWGLVDDDGLTKDFPIPFPNACFVITACAKLDDWDAGSSTTAWIVSPSQFRLRNGGAATTGEPNFYMAIGW